MVSTKPVAEIHVWLDTASDTSPAWIVSREDGDASDTVKVFGVDEYAEAVDFGESLARKDGLTLISIDEYGNREQMYPE